MLVLALVGGGGRREGREGTTYGAGLVVGVEVGQCDWDDFL